MSSYICVAILGSCYYKYMGVYWYRVSVDCLNQIMQFSTYMVMKPFNSELCGILFVDSALQM